MVSSILVWAVTLLTLPVYSTQARSTQGPFDAQVTIHVTGEGTASFDLVASTAPHVDPPARHSTKETAQQMRLYSPPEALHAYGCSKSEAEQWRTPPQPFALLLKRGKCTFLQKASMAASIGADAIIVYNEEKELYNTTTGFLHNPCILDCSKGESVGSATDCESSPQCGSKYCLSNPVYPKHDDAHYCCVEEKLIVMNFGRNASGLTVMAAYVNHASGKILVKSLNERRESQYLYVQIYRPDLRSISSLFLMWIGGTAVVCAATFISQRREREHIAYTFCGRKVVGSKDEVERDGDSENEPETLDLSPSVVGTFFVFSCVFLLFLFFLVSYFPRRVIMMFIILFGIGSVAATSSILIKPVFQLCQSWCRRSVVLYGQELVTVEVLAIATSIAIVVVWFIYRHSQWTWILQDTLAFAVACAFLATTRISNLKHGALLLGSFFFYDIFMTFLTPLLFGGKSVMVEVATAGKGSEHVSKDRHTCERTLTEKMPMLFLFPDGFGGLSVLGLGDVFLPGIFIAYCLRVDYLDMQLAQVKKSTPLSFCTFLCGHKYYLATCSAYAFGFMATILANIFGVTVNGVQGQPALLYLVPSVLGAFTLVAHCKGDLHLLWNFSIAEIEAQRRSRSHSGDDGETQMLVGSSTP